MDKIIVVAGKNQIAIDVLKAVLERFPQYQIWACCNKTDDGVDGWQPSFKRFCANNHVPTVTLSDCYTKENLIFLSVEFDLIIAPSKFHPTSKQFNIHFSKLPAYKGMYTAVWPLLNGEKQGGVTLHLIDAGIDTGDVIEQSVFEISDSMNAQDYYHACLAAGTNLVVKNLDKLVHGTVTTVPQKAVGASYYNKASIDFRNIEINFRKTAWEIHNTIRAYSFRAYQLPSINGRKVHYSVISNVKSNAKPGTAVRSSLTNSTFATIDFDIIVYWDFQDELLAAAKLGDLETVKEIASHFPLHYRTKQGWDVGIVAAYNNSVVVLEWLLNNNHLDINTTNYQQTSLLMYAMTAAGLGKGFESLLLVKQRLTTAGLFSKALQRNDSRGNNIHFYAAQYNNTELLNILAN